MKTFVTVMFLLSLGLLAKAQVIQGTVFSKGENGNEILPGASVAWLGTEIGTIANERGEFKIPVQGASEKMLVVSFVGFRSDTLDVGQRNQLTIVLEQDATSLDTVTITGKRPTAYISSDAVKTEVITQAELTKSACCDLAGCFETQATVQPQTTNVITNSKELRILGLSGVYNQVLFDGMPMIQGLTYTYGISSYPGTLVDNIFVSKGANSVLQGYESISGQINIIPKAPTKTDKLLLNAYMNSFLEKHFNVNVALPVGKSQKWHTLLAAHSVLPARKIDRDKDQFLDLPLLKRIMVYNRWQYGEEKENGLYLHVGLRYLEEQRIGGQTFFDPVHGKGGTSAYGQMVHYRQPDFYTKTGYRFNEKHALVLMASSFYQGQDSWFGTASYNAQQLNGYANLQHEYLWKERHLLKYGVSYRYQKLNEAIAFADTIGRTYAGTYRSVQSVPGIFAENAFHWGNDKWVLINGARLDHHNDFGWFLTPRSLLKYEVNANHALRASIGTGWRKVNLFSENMNLLASSRDIVFVEKLRPEQGLNWGFNYTWRIEKAKWEGTLSADFYQTRFSNQFFPDYDSEPAKAIVRNFTGKSVSNGLQVEANLKFFEVLEFRTAYNFLDVYRMYGSEKYLLPFNPRNRLMVAVSYRPKNERWYFDLNAHGYDRQRLPNTALYPEQYRRPDFSRRYMLLNAQVTFKVGKFEIYSGCENIFDFRQLRPIISWQDPFGPYFDTASVWGPTRGREIYLGLRFKVKG